MFKPFRELLIMSYLTAFLISIIHLIPFYIFSRSRKRKTRLRLKGISDPTKAFNGAAQHEGQTAQR